jgi:hypothetical protein
MARISRPSRPVAHTVVHSSGEQFNSAGKGAREDAREPPERRFRWAIIAAVRHPNDP